MRYLEQVNLVAREREPGSRRDHHRVYDDSWYEAAAHREQLVSRWSATVREGIAVVVADTEAGERLAEMLAFCDFLREEMPATLARWRERKAQLRSARAG